jgi:hypothetical protein
MNLLIIIVLALFMPPAEPPRLSAFTRQADGASTALLTITVVTDAPRVVHVFPPAGWGAAFQYTVVGTDAREAQLRAEGAAPGLATVIVQSGALTARAWVRGPGERAPAAIRHEGIYLPLIRKP